MKPQDYILNDAGDLKIQNGDFVFGNVTDQNQKLLLLAEPGELLHAPLRGVGLRSYQDDENPQQMVRNIRKEFVQDGMKVKSIEITKGNLEIDAEYE